MHLILTLKVNHLKILFRQSPGVSSTSEAFAARLGKMWQGKSLIRNRCRQVLPRLTIEVGSTVNEWQVRTGAKKRIDLKCCFASHQVFSFITESVRREIRRDVARDIISEIAAGKFGPD